MAIENHIFGFKCLYFHINETIMLPIQKFLPRYSIWSILGHVSHSTAPLGVAVPGDRSIYRSYYHSVGEKCHVLICFVLNEKEMETEFSTRLSNQLHITLL